MGPWQYDLGQRLGTASWIALREACSPVSENEGGVSFEDWEKAKGKRMMRGWTLEHYFCSLAGGCFDEVVEWLAIFCGGELEG